MAHARSAFVTDFSGDRFVMRNFFLDGLHHSALATFRITGRDDLLGNDVITAGFHLACFGAVSGAGGSAEH